MLEVADIHVSYGKLPTLHGVSLTAQPGQITCLLGRNGAGKSTTLKTIMGQLQPTQGSISQNGKSAPQNVTMIAAPGNMKSFIIKNKSEQMPMTMKVFCSL